MSDKKIILQATGLNRVFTRKPGLLHKLQTMHAVNNVSLKLHQGETIGIVGESGCGKSTLARMLAGLDQPSTGQVQLLGKNTEQHDLLKNRSLASKIQYVFQDPIASLNPRKTVEQILNAPLVHLCNMNKQARQKKISELLNLVGLHEDFLQRYPHEFSGGQAQRIGIARALAVQPRVLVLDEPVSALDVSIQAQILKLLQDLKQELGLSYVFISHDLSVIESISDRVYVMYFGNVVEQANSKYIFQQPKHPYTRLLLRSAPDINKQDNPATRVTDGQELPDPYHPPKGCSFYKRCSNALEKCSQLIPALENDTESDHQWACFNPERNRNSN